MILSTQPIDHLASSSSLPKGFIEVPTLSAKSKLMLISVSTIAHIKVRDSKIHIILLPQRYFTGAKSIVTSHSYDQVKAMIATAQK